MSPCHFLESRWNRLGKDRSRKSVHPETNHYHWILDTPETNLVRGMGWFQNTCTCRFNHRHRLWGGLGLGMEALGLSDPDIRTQVRGSGGSA
jgi:hypothetical protein